MTLSNMPLDDRHQIEESCGYTFQVDPHKYLKRAARMGHPESQLEYAKQLLGKPCVTRDDIMLVQKYLQAAAGNDLAEAGSLLKDLRGQGTFDIPPMSQGEDL